MTQAATFARILTDQPRRSLAIPPPGGALEEVVATAVRHLAKKYRSEVDQAEDTIEKYGLTIEVTRLRDRLARAATSDLERLVLSTPGVPEALFNKAVEKELEEERAREPRPHRAPPKGAAAKSGPAKPPGGAVAARKRPAPRPATGATRTGAGSNADPALAEAGVPQGGEQS